MQNLFIICFLVVSLGISLIFAETECGDDVLKEIQDSEEGFRDLSTNSTCPEHFQVCSLPEVQQLSIGDEVSSLCRLHTSTSHADNLVISYQTGGENESSTTVDLTLCHKVQSSMFPFDLVVVRPNNTNSNREAKIYIRNVRQETRLNVLCTARQLKDGLQMADVANNTLTIEFILSPSTDLTTDVTATEPPIDIGLTASLVVIGAALVIFTAVLVIVICICKKKKICQAKSSQQKDKQEMGNRAVISVLQ